MSETIINDIDLSKYFKNHYDSWGRLYCIEYKGNPLELQNDIKRLQEENEGLKSLNDFNVQKIEVLQEENEKLKKRQITKNGFICDCEQNAKYKQALEEIRDIAEKLITETPEYHSCYYKDECGDKCTPKQQNKVTYCCYENVEKIENLINEVLNVENN